MKTSRVLLLTTAMIVAWGQANAQTINGDAQRWQERPVPQTQPADSSLLDRLRQAPDPSAAISLYAEAAAESTDPMTVRSVFIQRMIEFGMPALAEEQARAIVEQDPSHGLAWAVLADAAGRRGETAIALTHMATAARASPGELFVQETAGKLLAWFDTHADPSQVTEEMRSAVQIIRTAMSGRERFQEAYDQAVTFYREQELSQRSAEAEPQPPAQEQEPTYVEQQPGQPAEPVYQTYNTYYTPSYYYGGYSAPYYYGGGYAAPYYYDYYSPYYGYAMPTYYYGGYYWPSHSTFIVAPVFWPRHHKFRHSDFFFSHRFYPRYFTSFHKRHGFGFGDHGVRSGSFGFLDGRYVHRDRRDSRFGTGFRSSIDRYTSPSIPRGVARDWARGRTASPSIPRGTFDRSTVGRSGSASASIPRSTFDRGAVSRSGTVGRSATVNRSGTVGRSGTASASIPRSTFNRGAVTRSGTTGRSATVDRSGTVGRSTPSASIPRSSVTAPRSSISAPRSALTIPRSSLATPRSSVRTPRSSVSLPRSSVSVPRSAAPRSAAPRSAAPRAAVTRRPSPSRSIGSRSFSVPRSSGISRSFSMPRSSGISRGFSAPRAPRSFSAGPRISGGGRSPSIARGGFSRGGASRGARR